MDLSTIPYTPTLAFGGWVGLLLLAGSLLASYYLLKQSGSSGNRDDDAPTTIATRGTFVPIVYGRYRVGAIAFYDGSPHRQSREVGGGKNEPGQIVYTEPGAHLLCMGPVQTLHAIYANNEVIWRGPMHSSTDESGTAVQLYDEETESTSWFFIFWGDKDQYAPGWLGDQLGVTSRWPGYCYVFWKPKSLGQGTTWPDLQYEITRACPANALDGSSYWLDDGESEGLNPAHLLHELLTAPGPWGLGMASWSLDKTSLEALGVLMEAEHLPANFVVTDGTPAKDVVQMICQEAGLAIVEVEGRLVFLPIREEAGAVPVLSDDVLAPPAPEKEVYHGPRPSDLAVFAFKSETHNYRDMDLHLKDAGQGTQRGVYKPQTSRVEMVTHGDPAGRIAQRRQQEVMGDLTKVKLSVMFGARLLLPGQAVDLPGFGRLRVLTKQLRQNSAVAELECALDTYALGSAANPFDPGGEAVGEAQAAAPDWAFTFFDYPGGGTPGIAVLRVRAHDQISGASVLIAGSGGTSYSLMGAQDAAAAGGTLLDGLDAASADPLEDGPVLDPANLDIQNALDLSADTANWDAGRQLLVLDDGTNQEAIYLRNVSAVAEADWAAETAAALDAVVQPLATSTGLRYVCVTAGTTGVEEPDWPEALGEQVEDGTVVWEARAFTYQLHGLRRAQYGTVAATFAAGTTAYLIDTTQVVKMTHPLVDAGGTVCVKTRPRGIAGSVDLSAVTAVCKTVTGSA